MRSSTEKILRNLSGLTGKALNTGQRASSAAANKYLNSLIKPPAPPSQLSTTGLYVKGRVNKIEGTPPPPPPPSSSVNNDASNVIPEGNTSTLSSLFEMLKILTFLPSNDQNPNVSDLRANLDEQQKNLITLSRKLDERQKVALQTLISENQANPDYLSSFLEMKDVEIEQLLDSQHDRIMSSDYIHKIKTLEDKNTNLENQLNDTTSAYEKAENANHALRNENADFYKKQVIAQLPNAMSDAAKTAYAEASLNMRAAEREVEEKKAVQETAKAYHTTLRASILTPKDKKKYDIAFTKYIESLNKSPSNKEKSPGKETLLYFFKNPTSEESIPKPLKEYKEWPSLGQAVAQYKTSITDLRTAEQKLQSAKSDFQALDNQRQEVLDAEKARQLQEAESQKAVKAQQEAAQRLQAKDQRLQSIKTRIENASQHSPEARLQVLEQLHKERESDKNLDSDPRGKLKAILQAIKEATGKKNKHKQRTSDAQAIEKMLEKYDGQCLLFGEPDTLSWGKKEQSEEGLFNVLSQNSETRALSENFTKYKKGLSEDFNRVRAFRQAYYQAWGQFEQSGAFDLDGEIKDSKTALCEKLNSEVSNAKAIENPVERLGALQQIKQRIPESLENDNRVVKPITTEIEKALDAIEKARRLQEQSDQQALDQTKNQSDQIKDLQATIDQLSTKITGKDVTITSLQDGIAAKDNTIRELESSRSGNLVALEILQAQYTALVEFNNRLKGQLEDQKNIYNEQFGKNKELTKDNEGLTLENSQLNQYLEEIRKSVSKLTEERDALKETNQINTRSLTEVENQVQDLTTENNGLRRDVDILRSGNQQAIVDFAGVLDGNQSEISQQADLITELTTEVDELKAQLESQKTAHQAELGDQKAALDKKLQELIKQNENLSMQNEDYTAQMISEQEKNQSLTNKVTDLQAELQEQSAQHENQRGMGAEDQRVAPLSTFAASRFGSAASSESGSDEESGYNPRKRQRPSSLENIIQKMQKQKNPGQPHKANTGLNVGTNRATIGMLPPIPGLDPNRNLSQSETNTFIPFSGETSSSKTRDSNKTQYQYIRQTLDGKVERDPEPNKDFIRGGEKDSATCYYQVDVAWKGDNDGSVGEEAMGKYIRALGGIEGLCDLYQCEADELSNKIPINASKEFQKGASKVLEESIQSYKCEVESEKSYSAMSTNSEKSRSRRLGSTRSSFEGSIGKATDRLSSVSSQRQNSGFSRSLSNSSSCSSQP